MKVAAVLGLSPSTDALVTELMDWRKLQYRWWNGADRTIDILTRIGEAREPGAIPHLMSFGLALDGGVREAARSAILQLYLLIPIDGLPELDESLRKSWSYLAEWYGMKPREVIAGETEADILYTALGTCHRDGHVREAAIRALPVGPSLPVAIPLVLLRLTDWVAEVRAQTEQFLRSNLTGANAAVFVSSLSLLGRLELSGRYRTDMGQSIEDFLRAPMCSGALRDGLVSENRGVRRLCFPIAAASNNAALPFAQVVALAIRDRDVVVRKWGFGGGFEAHHDEWTLIEKASRDTYGPIRRLAFKELQGRQPIVHEDLAPFLFDRSKSIRRSCQELFGPNVARHYRAARGSTSASGPQLAISLLGLTETGELHDLPTFTSFLRNGSPRVRRAAVRGLSRIGVGGSEEALWSLVESDAPSVAKLAAFALLVRGGVDAESVWEAATRNPNSRVRRNVLMIVHNAGKWMQLRIYLRALDSKDPDQCLCATERIGNWLVRFNSSFAVRTATDQQVLDGLLHNVGDSLSGAMKRQLQFILGT